MYKLHTSEVAIGTGEKFTELLRRLSTYPGLKEHRVFTKLGDSLGSHLELTFETFNDQAFFLAFEGSTGFTFVS
jgi:hypothetical protein